MVFGGKKTGINSLSPVAFDAKAGKSLPAVPVLQKKTRLHKTSPAPDAHQPVVQRVLISKKGIAGGNEFVRLVNSILMKQFRISLDANHSISIVPGQTTKTLPPEAQVLLSLLKKIIYSKDKVIIDFSVNNPDVFIGGYEQEAIDPTDAEKFGVNPGPKAGPSAASMLVHELEEQFQKQVNNIPMGEEDSEDA